MFRISGKTLVTNATPAAQPAQSTNTIPAAVGTEAIQPAGPSVKPVSNGSETYAIAKEALTGILKQNLLGQVSQRNAEKLGKKLSQQETPVAGQKDSQNKSNFEIKREYLPFIKADQDIHRPGFDMVPGRLRNPLFVKDGSDVHEVDVNDITQGGNVGDCFLLAPLAALAQKDPERIKNMIRDNNDGTYTVTFKQRLPGEPAEYRDYPVTVTADFPGGLNDTNNHAKSGDTAAYGKREIWPLIIEKAYGEFVKQTRTTLDPYTNLTYGGKTAEALEALTGRPVKSFPDKGKGLANPFSNYDVNHPKVPFDQLKDDFDAGHSIVFSTHPEGFQPSNPYGVVEKHAYSLKRIYTDANGQQWVELNNPWGKQHPTPIPYEAVTDLFARINTTGNATDTPFGL